MNKDNAKDYLPLVQALAEGKVIQVEGSSSWEDCPNPQFSCSPSFYRIKPKTIEAWGMLSKEGEVMNFFFTKEAAQRYHPQYKIVHLVQVED